MNPEKIAEKLAMLTPHGVRMGHIPGGIAHITQMDVAGMMAGCEPYEVALLRAMYCDDLGQFYRGCSYFFDHCKKQDWGDTEKTRVLAETVYQEHVLTPRCTSCNGTKGKLKGHQWVECGACHGRGKYIFSDRSLGRKMGMSRLKEPWLSRVSWAKHEVHVWEQNALAKFS